MAFSLFWQLKTETFSPKLFFDFPNFPNILSLAAKMRSSVIALGLFRFHWKPSFLFFLFFYFFYFFFRKCTFPFEIVNLMAKIPHFIDKTFEQAVVTHSAEDAYSWKASR